MDRERFQRVEQLFLEAVARDGLDREAFLASECAGDGQLRQEVERLLEADRDAPARLAAAVAPALRSLYIHLGPGSRVGPYEILALVGEGGMGSVYRARRCDDVFRKDVAIKVVKRGMDTDAILRRFTRERRILATLEHPHIARVLDGGSTEDGRPYLVMEYVAGRPVIEYCGERALGLNERLRLFQTVCGAVEHAHRHLVVHRDLKPSNIQVDEEGQPHLLDFGIAKLLDQTDEGTLLTTDNVRLFTPTYASPEQINGDPVGAASDVYSLGLVLFEMLTGCPARSSARAGIDLREIDAPSRIARAARDSGTPVPIPPEKLRGDLDRIVLKAVEQDVRLRYGSVEQFAGDISAYLESRPILARPQTRRYRTRKFVSRHRTSLAAAFLVFLSLVGGIAYSTYYARRAEARFQQVRQLANAFVFDVHDAIQPLPGSTKARRVLVATGLKYLDSLALDAGGDPELQWEVAQAYVKLGDVQGGPRIGPHLGDTAGALASYGKAITLLEQLASRQPDDVRVLRVLSTACRTYGDLKEYAGRSGEAFDAFTRAMTHAARLASHPRHEPADLRHRALAQSRIGERLAARGDNEAAIGRFKEALTDFEEYARSTPFETGQAHIAYGLLRLATAYGARGDVDLALQAHREFARIREELSARDPKNVALQRELAVAYTYLGDQLYSPFVFSAGQRSEAMTVYRKALDIWERVAAADPDDARAQRDLGLALLKFARTLVPDNPEHAWRLTERAERMARASAEADPASEDLRRIWFNALYELASRQRALHRFGDAQRIAETSLRGLEDLARKDPDNRRDAADVRLLLGDISFDVRDVPAAHRHYTESLRLTDSLHAEMPNDLFVLRQRADAQERLGRLHASSCAASREWLEKSLATWKTWGNAGGAASYQQKRQREIAARVPVCG